MQIFFGLQRLQTNTSCFEDVGRSLMSDESQLNQLMITINLYIEPSSQAGVRRALGEIILWLHA